MLTGKKLGFLGGGQMGEAIFSGALKAGKITADSLWVTDVLDSRLETLQQRYGLHTLPNSTAGEGIGALAQTCDMVVLAIKPQHAPEVLKGAGAAFGPGQLVISIIGGITLKTLEGWFPHTPVVRVMPNTPAQVGRGSTAIAPGHTATEADIALCRALFDAVGESYQIPESMLNAFTAVGGCGPAYAYLFIEALADGGVQQGMPRAMAQRVAAQMLAGAAEMALSTGEHPGLLKDQVCSPGGGTIEGVHALEAGGFRGVVMDAVEAGRMRMDELGRE